MHELHADEYPANYELEDNITRASGEIAVAAALSQPENNRNRAVNRRLDRFNTYSGSDSLALYLNEIGRYPLLTAAAEKELAKKIELKSNLLELLDNNQDLTDDQLQIIHEADEAKNKFIVSNLRLVVSIARRYPLPTGVDLLDLIQEGNFGLEHAVDKFDWRKGFKFSSYATFWIRQSIGRFMDQRGNLIRIPGDRASGLRASLQRVKGNEKHLNGEDARLYLLTTPSSLDKPTNDNENTFTLKESLRSTIVEPEDALLSIADAEFLESILCTIDKRSRFALEAHYGRIDGRSQSFREIGEQLGITGEAARRIVARAMLRLRNDARKSADV